MEYLATEVGFLIPIYEAFAYSRAGRESLGVYGHSRLDERPDLLRILGRRRIVDHQAEIGPAIDAKVEYSDRLGGARGCASPSVYPLTSVASNSPKRFSISPG